MRSIIVTPLSTLICLVKMSVEVKVVVRKLVSEENQDGEVVPVEVEFGVSSFRIRVSSSVILWSSACRAPRVKEDRA